MMYSFTEEGKLIKDCSQEPGIPERMDNGSIVAQGLRIYAAWKKHEKYSRIWKISEFDGKKWTPL